MVFNNVPAFTDSDLKRLKDRESDGLLQVWLSWDERHTLLARLEAAEACIGFNSRHSEWDERYQTWLRAKGEGL